MKFAYYPGCSAQSTCKELNASMLKVANRLGLELTELTSASCTGSREIRAVKPDLFLALNARIIAMAEQASLPLMTICNTCTLNLLDTQKRLDEDPETKDRINELLREFNLHYRGTCRITHFLWVLLEDIGADRLRDMVVRPLRGMKLAAFYGCHIIRPPAHYGFFDSRNARSIEKINEILGCESIDYSGRTECCGFHTAAGDEKVAIKLTVAISNLPKNKARKRWLPHARFVIPSSIRSSLKWRKISRRGSGCLFFIFPSSSVWHLACHPRSLSSIAISCPWTYLDCGRDHLSGRGGHAENRGFAEQTRKGDLP